MTNKSIKDKRYKTNLKKLRMDIVTKKKKLGMNICLAELAFVKSKFVLSHKFIT